MPIIDPVPSEALEVDSKPGEAIMGYKGTLPEGFLATLPTSSDQIPIRPTLYFFGKVLYQSIGVTTEIQFCSYLAQQDSISNEMGYTTPGDPKYILMGCPRWNSETIITAANKH